MLPSALCHLSVNVEAERVVPRYFTARDLPWLEALFDVYAEFVGQKRGALRERLREPLALRAPLAKLRVASHLLDSLCQGRVNACVAPREARWAVFRAATMSRISREQTLEEVAATLGVSSEALEAALFADLESEKSVAAFPLELSPQSFVPIANQAIVKSLLRRALLVRVRAWDQAGTLIRWTRDLGLICTLESMPEALGEGTADAATLHISGPFALFRRTQVYAGALALLLSAVTRCARFELEASCVLGRIKRPLRLSVSSVDPIHAYEAPAASASRVRERFVRDFRRTAPQWELNLLSEFSGADGSPNQADFELVHRSDSSRRWQLEVLGFWTREHLRQRLSQAKEGDVRTLLCVDQTRACDENDLVKHSHCVPYKNRIDPARVLAVIENEHAVFVEAPPSKGSQAGKGLRSAR